ncbi:DUF262 domain-containing protein [Subtercola endophyticus]|uniref:DUF262 domain-containing protein n=1 Tax=Subtercola endophyticus TaxID=2895559 RepID=UPI001E51C22C|nr:DUF262 domain-containing protein [Subtercola endophyticus]UFS58706.1 DUF262 domain-containing HNH endonuclease family protein [Subtercola endophyticus]
MVVPQENFLDYKALGVAELLRTRSLAVPIYQRSYSWVTAQKDAASSIGPDDKFQVVEFWEDLNASFNNQAGYFLGTVVIAADGVGGAGRDLIIDGQQRLATASLLLAAIRDKCESGGEPAAAASTQSDYLGKYDKVAKKDQPKLILNTDDREFYENRVVRRQDVTPVGFSQNLIESAYLYLRDRVDEFAKAHGTSWEPKLAELETWLDKQVQVVAITVPSESDAFSIFETLNDRGADLTVADLLKNYLFSQAGDQRLAEVQKNWSLTLSNLGIEKVGNQSFTNFARHLLSSKYGLVRERDVYRKLKSIVFDSASAVQFTLELETASRLYYAILHSDSDFWGDYSAKVANAADVIADLQIERYRPLIMAVIPTFSTKEIEKFMTTLVSWSVRMLCAGSLSGGVAEAAFCEAALEVRKKSVTSTAELLTKTKIGSLIPSDELFRAEFAEWKTTAKLSRYLLRALELQKRGDFDPELVVNADVDAVNLEHILPKNAKQAEWPSFTADGKKLWVDRVGNHALLQRGKNARIGNKAWAAKQPILASSSIELTNEASVWADWTEKSIADRQSGLAALAILCWPRDPK